jgi:hypothetical protein
MLFTVNIPDKNLIGRMISARWQWKLSVKHVDFFNQGIYDGVQYMVCCCLYFYYFELGSVMLRKLYKMQITV